MVDATDSTDATCPVCGLENAFDVPQSWEICPRCYWEDEPFQRADPDLWGGANPISLNQARQAWQACIDVFVMPWEVHLMSSEEYRQSDLGSREHVLKALSESIPDMDLSDPSWGTLRIGNLLMEFAVGDEASIKSLWVHAYGNGDPISVLKPLCEQTGWLALDTWYTRMSNSASFLDFGPQSEQAWQEWQRARNQLLEYTAQQAANRGMRLVFTTISEIRSTKRVEDFEDIRNR